MQATFGVERELHNELFYKECENDDWDFHFHSQIELCFVEEGQMEVLIDNQKKVLQEGEMSVALSFVAHGYKPIDYSRSAVLIIPTHACEDFLAVIKQQQLVNPFICDKEVVRKIRYCFQQIKQEHTNKIALKGYVYLILGTILEHVGLQQVSEAKEPELSSKVLLYLHENFKDDISLSTLSATFGYSPSYLSRNFKACFHIGINRYLRMIRLKNAIMLIHENKHSATYCALESGFNSLCTFYRVFHEEFGCSPKEYLSRV